MSVDKRTFVRYARYAVYAFVVVALGYLVLRFDMITLPEEGCSPLRSISPGDRLVVDLWPGRLAEGDPVLFRDESGKLLLGKVGTVPETAPESYAAAVAAGAYWIVADDPRCPAPDSRALGPIDAEAIAGKVFLAF